MTTYEKRIDSATENAIARLESQAIKAERKGNLERAETFRRNAEYLRSQQ